MKTSNTRRAVISLALIGPFAVTAWAHGTIHHGQSRPEGAVVRDQKPWGIAAETGQARRTITIRMSDDMRFSPAHIALREGETVRLRAVNRGKVMHELVIGDRQELEAHAALMKKHPTMEHDEPYMAHVAPGRRGDIVWTFNRPGQFEFACLIPGHFEAGMRGTIEVRPLTN